MALNIPQLRLALMAMQQKNDAASHVLKMRQNELNDLEAKAANVRLRRSHALPEAKELSAASLKGITLWRASTDTLIKKIEIERDQLIDELNEAKSEAAQSRMQLEALKALLKKETENQTLLHKRVEQNILPVKPRKPL